MRGRRYRAGEKFNYAGLRYGKIICSADADRRVPHFDAMLAFLFRHMPELIRKATSTGPPAAVLDHWVGKETFWARDDNHKEEILAGLRANAKYEITRFKGLGEMDAKVLAETTLDPRKRTLLQVQIDSNLDADKMFVELLGQDPSQRYRVLMDSAALAVAEELDV